MSATNRILDRQTLVTALDAAVGAKNAANILLAGPWGSGKTALLEDLRKKIEGQTPGQYHVMWFSPWDTIADGDASAAFVRLLRNEFSRLHLRCPGLDHTLWQRIIKLLKVLANAAEIVSRPTGILAQLTIALIENRELAGKTDESVTLKLRQEVGKLLSTIANNRGKRRILLLVDDLDRARPEQAVTILDGLYHLLMPHDDDADWPLTSVWAVNTSVLEEFLYREYRELPSFDPNAYLEKLFSRRVNVPPLFQLGADSEPRQLWQATLEPLCPAFSKLNILVPELACKLAEEVNYSILGNLRLHARVRRECVRRWASLESGNVVPSMAVLIRDARLNVLIAAFPAFRDRIAPFNGMWSVFLNQMNRRLAERIGDWVANPLYRHVDSPDLATLLEDLGAIRYDADRNCYALAPEGRRRLQEDLNERWIAGL